MQYQITVKPNSKKEGIEKLDEESFVVRTHKIAHDGEANKDVIKQLSKYFRVAKTRIEITKGVNSKNKVIEIKL